MRDCGSCYPPAEDAPAREVVERFADFLRAAGRPATRADIAAGRFRLRTPAERYRVRFLAWRMGQVEGAA